MISARQLLEAAADYAERRLASRSANRPNRLGTIDPTYDWSTYPGTKPSVTLDGESAPTKPLTVVGSYWPRANDRVQLMPSGSTYVIVGPILRTTDPASGSAVRINKIGSSSQVDTVTTAEADLPGVVLDLPMRNGARWWAHWDLDVENRATTAGLLAARISVGGVSVTVPEVHFKPSNVAAGLRLTVGASTDGTIVSSTPRNANGTVRFKVTVYRVGGAADNEFRVYASHSVLSVLTVE